MYHKILLPMDNSSYSQWCLEKGIDLSRRFGTEIVGYHVYSAQLHEGRFQEMEGALPQQYQRPEVLERQKGLHQSLISRGLHIISRSYLEAAARRCQEARVPFQGKISPGKNFVEIVKEARNGYDLIILGVLGLGSTDGNCIGSVCERVVRRVDIDTLVIKGEFPLASLIIVAVDGSPNSWKGLRQALTLAKAFESKVEIAAAFDPHFHPLAFQKLVDVLSPEAGKLFRLQEQEQLHREVIDQGLAQIYQGHLDQAKEVAKQEGLQVHTTLLQGKPSSQICQYARERGASLVVAGRYGLHRLPETDIGSTAENLLRSAPCHVLLVANNPSSP